MTEEQTAAIQAMHDRWQRDMSGLETESLEDQIGICMSKDAEALGFFLGVCSTKDERRAFLRGFRQGTAHNDCGPQGQSEAFATWIAATRADGVRRVGDLWPQVAEEVGTERDAGGA